MNSSSRSSAAWIASLGQERHFAYQQRFPDSAAFNVPIAATFTGPVDHTALEAALRAVAARHEPLRCSFVRERGLLRGVPHPAESVPVTQHDLRGSTELELGTELARIGSTEAARPFDLAAEPAMRAHVVRLREDETALVLNVHHTSFDGWSSPVFFRDLSDRYQELTEDRAAGTAQFEDVFADFAMQQRRRLTAGGFDGEIAYWRDRLAEPAPPAQWPSDDRDKDAPWWAGDMAWATIPEELVEALRRAAAAERTTLFGWTLAVYKVALHRFLDARSVAIGSPYAARTDQRWHDLVGFFANTLVFGYEFDPDETLRDLVRRTHAQAMSGHRQQNVPYGVLVDRFQPPVQEGRTPYFQTMFIVQNTPLPDARFGPLRLRTTKIVTGSARYDLTCCLGWRRGRLALELETRPALLGQETALRFADLFFGLLAASVAEADTRVGALTPLPVRLGVRRGRERTDSVDGLFEGLVGDWRTKEPR